MDKCGKESDTIFVIQKLWRTMKSFWKRHQQLLGVTTFWLPSCFYKYWEDLNTWNLKCFYRWFCFCQFCCYLSQVACVIQTSPLLKWLDMVLSLSAHSELLHIVQLHRDKTTEVPLQSLSCFHFFRSSPGELQCIVAFPSPLHHRYTKPHKVLQTSSHFFFHTKKMSLPFICFVEFHIWSSHRL